jgi:hypothetical protein
LPPIIILIDFDSCRKTWKSSYGGQWSYTIHAVYKNQCCRINMIRIRIRIRKGIIILFQIPTFFLLSSAKFINLKYIIMCLRLHQVNRYSSDSRAGFSRILFDKIYYKTVLITVLASKLNAPKGNVKAKKSAKTIIKLSTNTFPRHAIWNYIDFRNLY